MMISTSNTQAPSEVAKQLFAVLSNSNPAQKKNDDLQALAQSTHLAASDLLPKGLVPSDQLSKLNELVSVMTNRRLDTPVRVCAEPLTNLSAGLLTHLDPKASAGLIALAEEIKALAESLQSQRPLDQVAMNLGNLSVALDAAVANLAALAEGIKALASRSLQPQKFFGMEDTNGKDLAAALVADTAKELTTQLNSTIPI